MAIPVRPAVLLLASLLAPALRAESGPWSVQLGAAQPGAGAKTWVGTAVGPSLDLMESFELGGADAVRMRFGYYTFKGSTSTLDRTITLPGGTAASYSAATNNELFGFTYGAEYVRTLPARLFVLAGFGVTYVSATSKGSFDLTAAESGVIASNYSANNFVPYVCAGLGLAITRSLDLEARWQSTSIKAQDRKLDLSAGGITPNASVAFGKMNVSTLSLGLTLHF